MQKTKVDIENIMKAQRIIGIELLKTEEFSRQHAHLSDSYAGIEMFLEIVTRK